MFAQGAKDAAGLAVDGDAPEAFAAEVDGAGVVVKAYAVVGNFARGAFVRGRCGRRPARNAKRACSAGASSRRPPAVEATVAEPVAVEDASVDVFTKVRPMEQYGSVESYQVSRHRRVWAKSESALSAR